MQEGRSKHACCFAVEVFDDAQQFDPSAFVASTRSLVPLERLRDDLQEHLADRKQELYDLINRDYADFILVSTKLSGVGSKVSHLREPMARLLARASGLRVSAEEEASRLEAKLEERRVVRERKNSVRRFLRFMSTLDTAEGVLGIGDRGADRLEDDLDAAGGGGEGGTGGGSVGVGEGARGRACWDVDEDDEGFDDPDLLAAFSGGLALATSDKAVLSAASVPGAAPDGGVEGDKAREEEGESSAAASRAQEECALLERAAHYALMMNADLQAAAEDEANGAGDADATSLLRGMSSRASRVEAEITRRLRSEFASLLKPRHPWPSTPAAGDGASAGNEAGGVPARGGLGSGGGGGGARESRRQALLSCLRPFSALGSGIEAEKQFARAVMQPFLEARFTPGIVDGSERGSSKGLGPLLNELLAYVKEVAGDAVEAAEDMFASPAGFDLEGSPLGEKDEKEEDGAKTGTVKEVDAMASLPVDLVCNGVWRPVQQVLMTRLSSIFATGMVAAQHLNFVLCMEFLEGLAAIAGGEKRPRIRHRPVSGGGVSSTLEARESTWNLPIYFQLRQGLSREISSRLEASLKAAARSRSGSSHSTGSAGVGGEGATAVEAGVQEEHEEALLAFDGPAFELGVFREAWRCLSLCWSNEVGISAVPLAPLPQAVPAGHRARRCLGGIEGGSISPPGRHRAGGCRPQQASRRSPERLRGGCGSPHLCAGGGGAKPRGPGGSLRKGRQGAGGGGGNGSRRGLGRARGQSVGEGDFTGGGTVQHHLTGCQGHHCHVPHDQQAAPAAAVPLRAQCPASAEGVRLEVGCQRVGQRAGRRRRGRMERSGCDVRLFEVPRNRLGASADGATNGEHPQQAESHRATGKPSRRGRPGALRQGQDHDAASV
ncbi:unnamed protein product [Ectocarpus sp. 6 AP-2014]